MPIYIKNFTWKQSESIIYIQIPAKGFSSKKVDILISEKFLKLHNKPFLFEIYLLHAINEKNAICRLTDTEILLELPKLELIDWEKLEGSYDKNEKMNLKKQAIEEIQMKTRKHIDEKLKKKAELDRFVIDEGMKMDSRNSQNIKMIRENLKTNTMNDFEKWRKETQISQLQNDITNQKISQPIAIINKSSKNKIVQKENTIKNTNIPPLRKGGTLTISFTDRVFPTPCRESSAHKEQVWLTKMNEARRASGFIAEDLRPEERDPQWCKEKGDELFRYGNYIGAINAYSHGIKLSEKLPCLFSNRAATHFAMGNFHKCVEDCSTALELLEPKCQANLKSRITCIVRRAAALTRIGMLSKGIDEMKYAIKLKPDDEKLKEDLWNMERAWEQDPDSD